MKFCKQTALYFALFLASCALLAGVYIAAVQKNKAAVVEEVLSVENGTAKENEDVYLYELPVEGQLIVKDEISSIMAEDATAASTPSFSVHSRPKYFTNAELAPEPKEGFARIAIIIDDVGVKPHLSKRTLEELPPQVTLAFLPYGEATSELSKQARAKGYEVMIHLPMQPHTPEGKHVASPGPAALTLEDTEADIRRKVRVNFAELAAISVGVNNHMGSAFTEWPEGMRTVLEEVSSEQLLFLDSLTTNHSAVRKAARGLPLPLLSRNVFLDHSLEEKDMEEALEKLVRIAHKNGSAIGIGHPHTETLSALKKWLPHLEQKRVQLVPITALLNREQ